MGGILDERRMSDHRAVKASLRILPQDLGDHDYRNIRFGITALCVLEFLAHETNYMRHATNHSVFLDGAVVATHRAKTRVRRLPPQRVGMTSGASQRQVLWRSGLNDRAGQALPWPFSRTLLASRTHATTKASTPSSCLHCLPRICNKFLRHAKASKH